MATLTLSLPEKPQTLVEIMNTGFKIGKATIQDLFPFTFMLAGLGYVMQPSTKPTFVDMVDWLTLGLFILGSITLLILHGSAVHRLYEIVLGHHDNFFIALKTGFKKALGLITVMLLYLLMVTFGTALFIIPGLYLATIFCFAPFLIVIDNKRNHSFYTQIKQSFVESYQLVKGHFWHTFGLMFSLIVVSSALATIIQLAFQHQIVLANLIIVLFWICFLPFWYGCILALLFDLKNRSSSMTASGHKQTKRRM